MSPETRALADWILKEIEAHITAHDRLAAIAASRSKWSVQDYHMCLLYHYRRLWYRMRKASGTRRSLPQTPYARVLRTLRRQAYELYASSNPDKRRRLRAAYGRPRITPRPPTPLPPYPYFPPALPPPHDP